MSEPPEEPGGFPQHGPPPQQPWHRRGLVHPTREAWLDDGDRTVVCVAFARDGEHVLDTVRGTRH